MKRHLYLEKEEILLNTFRSIKARITREAREIEKLKNIYIDHQKKFEKQSIALTDYSYHTQKYERIKNQVKHFAITDAKHFEEVWLMIEEEVKLLAQRALAINSVISQQLYGSPEQQPDLNLLLLSSPFRPWKMRTEIVQTQLPPAESPAESSIEVLDTTETTEEELAFIDSSPEWEGEKLDEETKEELRALLCNEMDFLIEAKILKLLAPLVTQEQTGVKLGSILYTLGIDEKDLPKLMDFLVRYTDQQNEQAGGSRSASVTGTSLDLIHPNHVLCALKSFLEQQSFRTSSVQELSRLWLSHARDSSGDEAYWNSLGNIIPEERVKLWDSTLRTLKQYHAVLTDISQLTQEQERLKDENAELRFEIDNHLKK